MAKPINLVYNAFNKIESDGKLMLDENFMMNIFKPLYKQLPELEDYLDWFFGEKQNMVYGSADKESRKPGMEMAKSQAFSPVDADERATYTRCVSLARDIASTMIMEMGDPSKVTSKYLDAFNGELSLKNKTAAQKKAGYGIRANNDPSEGNFAVFDDALSSSGRIDYSRACSEATTRYNKDWN